MNNKNITPSQSLIADRRIRKTFHNNEWWFSVEDVVNGFMDSGNFQKNIQKVKAHDPILEQEWGRIVAPVLIPNENKIHECVTLEGAFRIIQAMPTPKAEPVRRWLAKTAFERLQEYQEKEIPKTDVNDVFKMLEKISTPEIAGRARKALEKRLKTKSCPIQKRD